MLTICGPKEGKEPTILMKQDDHEVMGFPDSLLPTPRNREAKVPNPVDRARALNAMKQDIEE